MTYLTNSWWEKDREEISDGLNNVRSSMFDGSKAKNRVFEFDYQKMNKFKSVRCSKN